MDEVRALLARTIRDRGEDLAGLSRWLGRNPAYLQQYLHRGVPRRLGEEDRAKLASYLGLDEAALGGPARAAARAETLLAVPWLEVGVSAGVGAHVEGEAELGPPLRLDPAMARRLAPGAGRDLHLVSVRGDSMEPLLADGDTIMVDRGDGLGRLRDGIYVLRLDESVMVKRITLGPARGRFAVSSDNRAYGGWPDCGPADVDVIGRVVWFARRMS